MVPLIYKKLVWVPLNTQNVFGHHHGNPIAQISRRAVLMESTASERTHNFGMRWQFFTDPGADQAFLWHDEWTSGFRNGFYRIERKMTTRNDCKMELSEKIWLTWSVLCILMEHRGNLVAQLPDMHTFTPWTDIGKQGQYRGPEQLAAGTLWVEPGHPSVLSACEQNLLRAGHCFRSTHVPISMWNC